MFLLYLIYTSICFCRIILVKEIINDNFLVKLQGEVARYKRKGKEANLEIVKLRKDLEDMKTAEIKALQAKRYELVLCWK